MKWPSQKEGAFLEAPAPLIQSPQRKTGNAFPQGVCKHEVTRTARLPDNHVHYAQLLCALCGVHLRWLPRPETIARRRVNAFSLAKLAMTPGLSHWERHFVSDVSKLRRLSPKQETLVARLCATYLEGKPS